MSFYFFLNITLEHILLQCVDLTENKEIYFQTFSRRMLFVNASVIDIFAFPKETDIK